MENKAEDIVEKDETLKEDEIHQKINNNEYNKNVETKDTQDTPPAKLKASEVYAEEAYELQAEKAEDVYVETLKEVEPPYEEPSREVLENEAKHNQKLLLLKHFGKSLGNMSIVLISFVIILISSQLILGVGTILLGLLLGTILFVLSIATLGIIYLIGADAMGRWWGYCGKLFEGGTDIINFLGQFYVAFPYMIIGSLAFSIISIITTAKSGPYKSVGRIVMSSIICGIAAILSIILIAGGLSAK